jgi:hypothetical protein
VDSEELIIVSGEFDRAASPQDSVCRGGRRLALGFLTPDACRGMRVSCVT